MASLKGKRVAENVLKLAQLTRQLSGCMRNGTCSIGLDRCEMGRDGERYSSSSTAFFNGCLVR